LALLALAASLVAAGCSESEITQPRVVSVDVSPTQHSLAVGEEVVLTARALDERGTVIGGRTIVWSSSDESIARVAATGRVTAQAEGTVSVRATVDGKVGAAQLVVVRAAVARIDLTPPAISLEEGAATTATAVARSATGAVLEGRIVAWSSSDATIASVDGTGQITARRIGSAKIVAAVESKTAEVPVTVTAASVASIAVSPTAIILEVGQSRALTAVTKDARGNVLTGRAVTWTSDSPNASVNPSGVVVGKAPGYATIIAASEGKTFGVGITVAPAEPSEYDLVYRQRNEHGVMEILALSLGTNDAPAPVYTSNGSNHPSSSPDGKQIAFAISLFDGLNRPIGDVYTVDRNGANFRRLTTAPGVNDQPAWSPVGGRIAYRHVEPGGRTDIWVMNADGSTPVNLTGDLQMAGEQSAPAWSADGTRIAFVSQQSGPTETTSSIWVMRADGSDKRMLTSTVTGFDASPTWSPDGQRIAFIRQYEFDSDITFVNATGGAPVRLELPGRQFTPAWSPGGEWIAYAQLEIGFMNLYTVRPNGTDVRLRTFDPSWGGGLEPAWSRKP
jgi:Tol biopolymer transport system component/uncharacterized protein YjdB